MNKILQVQFLLEYISKSKKTPLDIQKVYRELVVLLEEFSAFESSIFQESQIQKIFQSKYNMTINTYEKAKSHLYTSIETKILREEKKAIFQTLMESNFKEYAKHLKKSQEDFEASLPKVEAKMYQMITLYIELLLTSLDLFVFFEDGVVEDVQKTTSYSIKVHDTLMQNIFYKEEREHVESGLRKLCTVYIGLYCKEFMT